MESLAHLHVETVGEGPLVLFTHGGGDQADGWRAQIEALAPQGFRCRSWDLRGHGSSHSPDDPAYYSRELALEDIGALLAGEAAVLVGHSLGGYLSMAYTLRHPDRVRALVLVATGPGFRDQTGRDAWNRRADKSMPAMGRPAASAGILRQHDSWVIDNLSEIRCPVLQVVGEKDEMFLRSTNYMATKLPGPVTTVVVAGAGHQVHARSKAGEVATAISEFLAALALHPGAVN
ncbi:MAG: alpha/beta fold hydrolase [Acidimicrobiales bacterium]